jgi:hypothetical protein
LTGIYFWGSKTVKKGVSEDFFFSVFSGRFFHRNVVLEGSQDFLFFAAFTGIFHRKSCETGIPDFTMDSTGLLRIPPDSSGFLFPPNAVLLWPETKVGFLLSKY